MTRADGIANPENLPLIFSRFREMSSQLFRIRRFRWWHALC